MSREEAAKKLRGNVLIGLAGLAAAAVTLALTGGKGIPGLLLPFAEAMVVVFSITQGIYHWRVMKGLVESEPEPGPDTLTPLPPVDAEAPAADGQAAEPDVPAETKAQKPSPVHEETASDTKPQADSGQDMEMQDIPKGAVFCPFCGEKLLKSGDFCPRCGKRREHNE